MLIFSPDFPLEPPRHPSRYKSTMERMSSVAERLRSLQLDEEESQRLQLMRLSKDRLPVIFLRGGLGPLGEIVERSWGHIYDRYTMIYIYMIYIYIYIH